MTIRDYLKEAKGVKGKSMKNLLIGLFTNVIRACLKKNEDPVELFNEALKRERK